MNHLFLYLCSHWWSAGPFQELHDDAAWPAGTAASVSSSLSPVAHRKHSLFCVWNHQNWTVGKHFMFRFLKQTRITHFETFHLLALMILIVVVLYVTALRVKTLNAARGWDVSHIESMYKCTNIALIFTSSMSQPWPWCLCSTDKGCHLQAYCEHTDINFNLNLSRHKEEVA